MKNTKKVLSIALAGALAFGSMGAAFAAEVAATPATAAPVAAAPVAAKTDAATNKAVAKLTAFGVVKGMEDGKYHPELELTRAQFAKMLVEALGLGTAAQNDTTKPNFKDVDESVKWAYGYINVAKGQGLLSGYPDGTFKPQAKVNYSEALTMLVRALGYKDSFVGGTWPNNYVAKAADLKVTDNVMLKDGAVDRGNAAVLVDNTLDTKMIVQKTFGTEVKYEESKKLLEEKLNVVKYEDVQVVGTPNVDTGVKKAQIKINYKPNVDKNDKEIATFDVNASKVNITNLLGEGVNVYYNTKDKEVVYVEKSKKEFTTYYDFIDNGEDFTKDAFNLYKADKKFNIADEKEVKYYLDNKTSSYDELKKLYDAKKQIFVKAVANEKGNIAVVEAQVFEKNGVVAVKADKDTLSYFDNDESTKDFKAKDYDKVSVVDTKGNVMSLADIKANDVLYINDKNMKGDDLEDASSKDEVAQIVVVRDVIKGKAKSYNQAKATIEIEGKDYDMASNATVSVDTNKKVKLFSDALNNLKDITKENADVLALLDAKGEVRHITTAVKASSSDLFGLVSGVDVRYNDVYVKLVNAEGKEVEYMIDADDEDIYGMNNLVNPTLSNTASLAYDFVKYTLNKNGKIDYIAVVADVDVNFAATKSDMLNKLGKSDVDVKEVNQATGTAENYKISKNSMRVTVGGTTKNLIVADDVVVFDYTAAKDSTGLKIGKVKDAEIVKWANLADKQLGTATKFVYITDKDGVVKGIAFTAGFDGLKTDTYNTAYVLKTRYNDGDLFADLLINGKLEKLQVESSSERDVENAVQGVIVVDKSSNGKVKVIKNDAKFETKTGKVAEIKGSTLKLTVATASGYETLTYKISSDASYAQKDDQKQYSDLDANDYVTVIADRGTVTSVKLYDADMKNAADKETIKFIGDAKSGTASSWNSLNPISQSINPTDPVFVSADATIFADFIYTNAADGTINLTVNDKLKSYTVVKGSLVQDKDGNNLTTTTITKDTKINFTLVEGTNNISYIKIAQYPAGTEILKAAENKVINANLNLKNATDALAKLTSDVETATKAADDATKAANDATKALATLNTSIKNLQAKANSARLTAANAANDPSKENLALEAEKTAADEVAKLPVAQTLVTTTADALVVKTKAFDDATKTKADNILSYTTVVATTQKSVNDAKADLTKIDSKK